MNVTIDLSEERVRALQARAQERGVSAEQYAQQVLEHDLEPVEAGKPLAAQIREIWSDLPGDARAKLPRDGASQHDHYIYGLPKREM